MPDTTAHYHFGQLVFEGLRREIKELLLSHKDFFGLGLQGPDILFYYKPLTKNEISDLGIKIHYEQASRILYDAVQKIKQSKDASALAYLLGFVCHFVLDSSFHREIAQAAPDIKAHFQLEAEMDRIILLHSYSPEPHAFKRYRLVKADMDSFDCLRAVYPGLSKKQIKKSAKSFVFFSRLLLSKHEIKKQLIKAIESILGKSGFYTSMMVCKEPNERFFKCAQSLCARIDGIVPVGVRAVENVYACAAGDEPLIELFNKNFE